MHVPSWDMPPFYQCSMYYADERARELRFIINQLSVIESACLNGNTKNRVGHAWNILDMGVQHSFRKNHGGKLKLGTLLK